MSDDLDLELGHHPEADEPQEPRTGGVLVRWDGGYGMFVPNSYGTQTHRVFPLAEAEALEAVEVAASVGRRDGWGAQAQYDMARALSVLHNLRNAALRGAK